jgi:hypothetical protein
MFLHFFFAPFFTCLPHVTHGLACLKFNPVWTHYLKVHHLTCSA